MDILGSPTKKESSIISDSDEEEDDIMVEVSDDEANKTLENYPCSRTCLQLRLTLGRWSQS